VRDVYIGSIILGIVIVVIGVVEWLAKISVIHAVAILTVIVGLYVALSGYGTYGPRGGPRV
jgi:hypothetical protein